MSAKAKIYFFDTHNFEKEYFSNSDISKYFGFTFFETKLDEHSASLANGADVVCAFVNDRLDANVLECLAKAGVKLVALRCAGFNNVDLEAAKRFNIKVCRVPAYSPNSVAEYTLGLLLCLSRKIHKSYHRVRELNFSLDGLVGFDISGKTVGVIGTGKIGKIFAKTVAAMGAKVLAYDIEEDQELKNLYNISYTELRNLCKDSDIISLHVPLNKESHHIINSDRIAEMKKGVYLINTGRGALIETKALIKALKTRHIGGAALDVYEEEENVFFSDLSNSGIDDDLLARLLTFPNVIISSHQAFLTKEALQNIADCTLMNVSEFIRTGAPQNEILVDN